ncbi:MAG TPA: hypothetical protein VFQ35_09535 [Polyangiaceae bacterium]|nr:hypothetical protein [Polyangiaceae bacterium]
MSPLPSALESSCVRGQLRVEEHDAITPATLASNQVLRAFLKKTKEGGGRLHLFGLVSDGGVSASLAHLFALIDSAKAASVRVVVHAFLDGIDAPANSARKYIDMLEAKLDGGVGRIGTVSGRTFGMAPEGRWDRVEKVYRAVMADGVDRADSAARGVEAACVWGVPEQFAAPFVVFDYPGVSLVDTALHFHFAPDGARELVQALAVPEFNRFARKGGRAPFAGRFATMTPYETALPIPTLFPRAPDPAELLLDILENPTCTTLTVTSGSAAEITTAAETAIRSGKYDFVFADLANPFNASRGRAETMGSAVTQITAAARDVGGAAMILGGRTGADAAPIAYVGDSRPQIRDQARTGDLAPTLLDLLGAPRPRHMEGTSLLLF